MRLFPQQYNKSIEVDGVSHPVPDELWEWVFAVLKEKDHYKQLCADNGLIEPEIRFTHQYVKGFGWENTCYLPEDFESVEFITKNEDGKIYSAKQENGVTQILRYKPN